MFRGKSKGPLADIVRNSTQVDSLSISDDDNNAVVIGMAGFNKKPMGFVKKTRTQVTNSHVTSQALVQG